MAQPVQAFAQPDDVRSIPETHRNDECRSAVQANVLMDEVKRLRKTSTQSRGLAQLICPDISP